MVIIMVEDKFILYQTYCSDSISEDITGEFSDAIYIKTKERKTNGKNRV